MEDDAGDLSFPTKDEGVSRELAYAGWIGRGMSGFGLQTAMFLKKTPQLVAAQRWMAFASEGTEPFRPVASVWFVRLGYGLSFLYVFADIGVRAYKTHEETKSAKETAILIGDTTVFHTFASMLLPAVTIHSIVKYSGKAIQKAHFLESVPRVRQWIPTIIGLCSIPFVIQPIDHGVLFALNNTTRRFYNLPKYAHSDHHHEEHPHPTETKSV